MRYYLFFQVHKTWSAFMPVFERATRNYLFSVPASPSSTKRAVLVVNKRNVTRKFKHALNYGKS